MTTTTPTVTTQEPAVEGRHRRARLSEGARAERRLGWLLCAPAVIVMIAVTAYPIGYAIYLSLQRYILSAPQLTSILSSGEKAIATACESCQSRWVPSRASANGGKGSPRASVRGVGSSADTRGNHPAGRL